MLPTISQGPVPVNTSSAFGTDAANSAVSDSSQSRLSVYNRSQPDMNPYRRSIQGHIPSPSDASSSGSRIPTFALIPTNGTFSSVNNVTVDALNRERVAKRTRQEYDCSNSDILRESVIMEFRKAAVFISRNEYMKFLAYENEFKLVFKDGYKFFETKSIPSALIISFIIKFGATNFLQSSFYRTSVMVKHDIIEAAFDRLIKSKSLAVVFEFIKAMRHMDRENVTKAISASIKKRYPNRHFLDFVIFEADFKRIKSINIEIAYKVFMAEREEYKLLFFCEFLMSTWKAKEFCEEGHYSQVRYLEAFYKYSEYFMTVDIEIRAIFAKLAIMNKDFDKLSKIIEFDPEIILHDPDNSLFGLAVDLGFTDSFQFFMEIIPEHFVLEIGSNRSPLANSIDRDNVQNLIALDACGFDFTQEIAYDGKMTTPVQLAFKYKRALVFNFFIEKIGRDYVLEQLLRVYGSEYEIIRAASFHLNDDIVLILKNKLEFSLNLN